MSVYCTLFSQTFYGLLFLLSYHYRCTCNVVFTNYRFPVPSCCTSQPPKKLNQLIIVNSSTKTPRSYHQKNNSCTLCMPVLWMLLEQHPLCHRMFKVTKESSGANKIMRNAIDFTSITLRWTLNSSQQSVFSMTSDGSQRSPNGGESRRRVYLVKSGPKSLRDRRQNLC